MSKEGVDDVEYPTKTSEGGKGFVGTKARGGNQTYGSCEEDLHKDLTIEINPEEDTHR